MIEPFGELRSDYRAAQIVAMAHNGVVKPEDQKKIEDFLLKFGGSGKKQSVDEQIMVLNILAAAMAGRSAE